MTFSIAARCASTGRFAVAVASSSLAVAARCNFAHAGVGAATTQNITDPRLGPQALDLMAPCPHTKALGEAFDGGTLPIESAVLDDKPQRSFNCRPAADPCATERSGLRPAPQAGTEARRFGRCG